MGERYTPQIVQPDIVKKHIARMYKEAADVAGVPFQVLNRAGDTYRARAIFHEFQARVPRRYVRIRIPLQTQEDWVAFHTEVHKIEQEEKGLYGITKRIARSRRISL